MSAEELEVTVVEPDQDPIPGAEAWVEWEHEPWHSAFAYTDREGRAATGAFGRRLLGAECE